MSKQDKDEQEATEANMPVYIRRQYVKDLSFENPHAPDILRSKDNPDLQARFNLGSRVLDEKNNIFEVSLGVTAKALRGDKVAFIAEIDYAVEVVVDSIKDEEMHPLLYIEIPRQAFPFVRQIIANLTQMGGYAPLLMRPVDFRSLYLEKFGSNPPIFDRGNDSDNKEEKKKESA